MQHGWNIELDSTETIFSFEDHLNHGKSDETSRIRQYCIKKIIWVPISNSTEET